MRIRRNDGSASALVIFVLLCLAIFSVLAMMLAYSDYKFSKKNLVAIDNFYKLDALATEKAAEIDAVLWQAQTEAASFINTGVISDTVKYRDEGDNNFPDSADKSEMLEWQYLAFARQGLAGIDGIDVTADPSLSDRSAVRSIPDHALTVSFTLGAVDLKQLTFAVTLNITQTSGGLRYTVEEWRLVANTDQEYDIPPNVWQGEE